MALSTSQMLTAIHKKDPSTLNKRYSDSQLRSLYGSMFGTPSSGSSTTAGGAPGTSTNTTGATTTTGGTQTTTTAPAETPEEAFARRQAEMNRTVESGMGLGRNIIDELGINGEFIPRIQEGPSQSYYDDLERLRQLSINAGNLSPLDLESLDVSRRALAGLDAPENEALRSAAAHQIDQQFGLQRNQLMRYQGGMGSPMQRAAQLGQLGSSRVDAQRNLSRDLLIENIQQKKDARLAFNNLINTVGARQDSRVQNLASLLQSGGQFTDSLKTSAQQYNSGSAAQEIAARTGALMGGIGTTSSLMGGYKAEEFQNKALTEALAAKQAEYENVKALTEATLKSQETIMNKLAGRI